MIAPAQKLAASRAQLLIEKRALLEKLEAIDRVLQQLEDRLERYRQETKP